MTVIVYTAPTSTVEIPIIDYSGASSLDPKERQIVAEKIGAACRRTGFFYVVNHGIERVLLDRQFAQARAFFAEPLAAKMQFAGAKGQRGYEPMAAQALDPGSPADLKESILFGATGPVWPDLPGFGDQMRDYMAAMTGLAKQLAASLALSLDLPESYFGPMLATPHITTRLLRYPPHPAAAAANQLGSGAHTDWGFLTLLLQDDVGGLEVRTVDGQWIDAAPVPGAIVINLGDMLPHLTNGLYRSNFHRVLNNASLRDRYSVATFTNPAAEVVFDCVPTCRPGDWRPAPRTVGDHIRAMIAKTYANA